MQNILGVLDFIDNAGVQLCVERRGSGPFHVLLLHGWISSRRMWDDVVDRLDERQISVHALDFRGCGLSDRPRHGHDLMGYVSDARAALQSIGAPAMIAGHSMGGKIAQYLASERPAQLKKLVLVAPGTAAGGSSTPRQRVKALEAYGNRIAIERFQRAAMAAPVSDDAMQRIVEDALLAQFEHWEGWYDRGRFTEFPDRLNRIAVPVLCIGGAKDPLIPPARMKREVAQAIRGALSITLRNAGHNLPVEAPAEIAAAITSSTS
jgi:3-oxoadipate enol-lactonase